MPESLTVSKAGKMATWTAVTLASFGAIGVYFDNFLVWILSDTFAQTEEVTRVVTETQQSVSSIEQSVTTITRVVSENTMSVRLLNLSLIDIKINDLEVEIQTLESQKRREGANWNENEELNLRRKQRALRDLERRRDAVMDEIDESE